MFIVGCRGLFGVRVSICAFVGPLARRCFGYMAIVEDELAIAQNYAASLQRHGYNVSHYAYHEQVMRAFTVRLPALAIIDVGLGDEAEGGFDLRRDLRARLSQLRIIFCNYSASEIFQV